MVDEIRALVGDGWRAMEAGAMVGACDGGGGDG